MKPADIQKLSPKQIAHLLTLADTIATIAAAVREHAVTLAHNGVIIPGYEAAWTNARRVWVNEDEAAELLDTLGLSKRERYSIDLLSPAQAEKALKAKKLWPKKTRGKAAEDFVNPFGKAVTHTDSQPTISKVSGNKQEP